MADYGYEAITKDGKTLKGSIEAESVEAATAVLKAKGYIVTDINEQSLLSKDINFNFDKKPSARDLAVFCNQFVAMSRAGVSILECLNLLREQTENKTLAKAIRETFHIGGICARFSDDHFVVCTTGSTDAHLLINR